MKISAGIAAWILLAWFAAAGADPADATKDRDRLPLAPDGVKYLNWDSYSAMQMKALSGNLVKNGSFEQGRWWPIGWDPCDKLGTIWAEGGTDGKRCIRIDTNLQEDQWVAWNEKVLAIAAQAAKQSGGDAQAADEDPIPDPPARQPTKAPFYDTVGGNHGIHYRCALIRVEPGAIYRLSVDARNNCGGEPMVFVKGFFERPTMTESGEQILERSIYRVERTLYKCDSEWRRFATVFHPALSKSTLEGKAKQPEWLRVELYAFWPVGVYEFDNVRLEIVGHGEIQVPPAPAKQPVEPAKTLKDGEFPVFGK
jgi:hypothetical protein